MSTLRNKVQLIGNVGNNPIMIVLESGKKVIRFSLATNENHKNAKVKQITFKGKVFFLTPSGEKGIAKGQHAKAMLLVLMFCTCN